MSLTYQPRNLSGAPSLFLDALRIVSALTVLYVHADEMTGAFYIQPDFGHIAVVVFFVLSGFVIAHTTSKNHRDKYQYATARLSRLYSVVLPAIVLTALIQLIVWKIQPYVYSQYTRGESLPRYLLSLFFMSETWFLSTSPPINGPLWSLSFEFWYYAIFGLFFYRVGKGIRSFLLPVLACLIAGPKILVMMPIWLAGCFAYRLRRPLLPNQLSFSLSVVFIVLSIILALLLPAFPHALGTAPMYYASQFVTDWMVGLSIACALWLLPDGQPGINRTERKWVKTFRAFADLTFPIYVLHMPLLVLYKAVFYEEVYTYPQMLVALFSVLSICMVTGMVLEKYRYFWTAFFAKLISRVQNNKETITKRLNTAN